MSGWLSPDILSNLLSEIAPNRDSPGQRYTAPNDLIAAQAELAARVQLHVALKQQLLDNRLGDRADKTARAVTRATWGLVIATSVLVLATIVLVFVTAHHGG